MTTNLAVRVARRHVRQVVVVLRNVPGSKTRLVEYSTGGRISAVELARILEPQLGVIVRLRFRPSLKIDPNGVAWEALDENGNVVAGTLVLHAGASENEIVSWAEVVIDRRADPIAARVAREYIRRGEGLVAVDDEEDDEPVDDEGEPRTVLVDPEHLRLIERADQRNP